MTSSADRTRHPKPRRGRPAARGAWALAAALALSCSAPLGPEATGFITLTLNGASRTFQVSPTGGSIVGASRSYDPATTVTICRVAAFSASTLPPSSGDMAIVEITTQVVPALTAVRVTYLPAGGGGRETFESPLVGVLTYSPASGAGARQTAVFVPLGSPVAMAVLAGAPPATTLARAEFSAEILP